MKIKHWSGYGVLYAYIRKQTNQILSIEVTGDHEQGLYKENMNLSDIKNRLFSRLNSVNMNDYDRVYVLEFDDKQRKHHCIFNFYEGKNSEKIVKNLFPKEVQYDFVTEYTMLEIEYMKDEPQYLGKTGRVTDIDSICQIHGTWGGCALIPWEDYFIVVGKIK